MNFRKDIWHQDFIKPTNFIRIKVVIQCLIYQTLQVSEEMEVELRRGEWLVLLGAWEGSATL